MTANAVAPGFIETFMTSHHSPEATAAYVAQVSAGRAAAPREVAEAIAWLASDAASYVNGAPLDVNGAWVMT